MANSQRFDGLFSWMSESNAIAVLNQPCKELDNPGIKYIAATRLGACRSVESLEALVVASSGEREDIFERITRRKAIEALGRRKDPSTLAVIQKALLSDDEQTVVNAVDSLITIGLPLTLEIKTILLCLLQHSSAAVQRVSIQGLSRCIRVVNVWLQSASSMRTDVKNHWRIVAGQGPSGRHTRLP